MPWPTRLISWTFASCALNLRRFTTSLSRFGAEVRCATWRWHDWTSAHHTRGRLRPRWVDDDLRIRDTSRATWLTGLAPVQGVSSMQHVHGVARRPARKRSRNPRPSHRLRPLPPPPAPPRPGHLLHLLHAIPIPVVRSALLMSKNRTDLGAECIHSLVPALLRVCPTGDATYRRFPRKTSSKLSGLSF